ncbi:MAG: hypothetical protein ABIT20_07765 [Gemmatimonadaceae bacterium]
MSADDKPRIDPPKTTDSDKIEDISDAKVSDKEASDLKGGRMPLNPQPLPPRH